MTSVRVKMPVLVILVLTFFLLTPFGCSKKEESVVAKVGRNTITVSDFKSYLSDRTIPPSYRVSKEDLKKRLDEMVLEEVLYQEVLSLKLDEEPQVRKRIRQMLTQKLMDDEMKREVWSKQIEENELQEFYDQHRNEFNRPEQVRLADIFIAVPANATEQERSERRKKAESALSAAIEIRNKRSGFGQLIRKYSDTHAKYRRGDTGYFDAEGKPVGLNSEFAKEAFQLKRIGDMSDHLIETQDGYHVIMLTGKRSAFHKGLNEVKSKIEQRIRREKLRKAHEAYIEGLKEKAGIRIDTQILSGILEELNNRTRTGQPLSTDINPPSMPGEGRTPPPLPVKE